MSRRPPSSPLFPYRPLFRPVIGDTAADADDDNATGLASLHVTGTTAINTSAITTTGVQTYDGTVTLSVGTNLTGSTVTFNNAIPPPPTPLTRPPPLPTSPSH